MEIFKPREQLVKETPKVDHGCVCRNILASHIKLKTQNSKVNDNVKRYFVVDLISFCREQCHSLIKLVVDWMKNVH